MKNKKYIYRLIMYQHIQYLYGYIKGGDFVWYLKEEDRPTIPRH